MPPFQILYYIQKNYFDMNWKFNELLLYDEITEQLENKYSETYFIS